MINRRNVLASTAAAVAASAVGAGAAQAAPVASAVARAGGRLAPVRITDPSVEYARQPLGLNPGCI